MPRPNDEPIEWMPVIGRALAFLCLHYGDLTDKPMVEQADFLQRLGIPRKEAATILGTSDESLSAMQRARRAEKRTPARKSPAKKSAAKGAGTRV
jgi:hypothetical protein